MHRRPIFQTGRIWYRFARRRTRHLRQLCITVLSLALVIDRVLRLAEHFSSTHVC